MMSWGLGGGDEPGRLMDPSDISLAPDGEILVTDGLRHRVLRFQSDGRWIAEWGGLGQDPGEMDTPTGIEVAPDGRIHVVEYLNNRVQTFDRDGRSLALARPGLYHAVDLAIDRSGQIFVGSGWNNEILQLGSQGEVVYRFSHPDIMDPRLVFASDGTLLVQKSHRQLGLDYDWVWRFSRDFGMLRQMRVPATSGALTALTRGGFLLSNPTTCEMHAYTPNGTPAGVIQGPPGEPLQAGYGAIDEGGRLHVIDAYNHSIKVFDTRPPESWRIEGYDNPWLARQAVSVQTQPGEALNWSPPARSMEHGPVESMRAHRLLALGEGLHRLELEFDGSARLWIDQSLVVDDWPRGTPEAGRVHQLWLAGPRVLRLRLEHRPLEADPSPLRLEIGGGMTRRDRLFLPRLDT
jgi:hypothetical protein